MSERAELIAGTLAKHVLGDFQEVRPGRYRRACLCGELLDMRDMAGSQRAHVAALLDALLDTQGAPPLMSNGQRRG